MTHEEIIKQYSQLVYALALQKTNNDTKAAEDIYQEVFLRYIEKKPVFEDEAHAKAWFAKTTRNVADALRKGNLSDKSAQDEETPPSEEKIQKQ